MKKYLWLKVDTASIMFSSLSSKKWGRTFGYSAYFDKNINPEMLKKACSDLMPYFPSVFAYLKKGFFWNYLALTDKLPEIRPEDERGMRPICVRDDRTPDFRLTYSENRVNIECSHSLGDGKGIMIFFEALLKRYNELVNGEKGEYVCKQNPAENITNAFADYYEPQGEKLAVKNPVAFHFEEKYEDDFLETVFLETDMLRVKELAKEKSCTVSEYLVAVLMLGIIRSSEEGIDKPVTVAVPVNLRRFFPTDTVRNFTIQSFVTFMPEGRKDITLDEIIEKTKGQLKKQLVPEELKKVVNNYGSLVNNPVLKRVPNAVKLPVMRKMQKDTHAGVSTILTNYGVCEPDASLAKNLQKLEFINGDTSHYGLAVTCSSITYNGKLTLCFSHANPDTSWCEKCAEILKEVGVPVNVYSRGGKGSTPKADTVKEKEPLTPEKIKAYFNM